MVTWQYRMNAWTWSENSLPNKMILCFCNSMLVIVTRSLTHTPLGLFCVLRVVVRIRSTAGVNQCSFAGFDTISHVYPSSLSFQICKHDNVDNVAYGPFNSVLKVCKYWLLQVSSCNIPILMQYMWKHEKWEMEDCLALVLSLRASLPHC